MQLISSEFFILDNEGSEDIQHYSNFFVVLKVDAKFQTRSQEYENCHTLVSSYLGKKREVQTGWHSYLIHPLSLPGPTWLLQWWWVTAKLCKITSFLSRGSYCGSWLCTGVRGHCPTCHLPICWYMPGRAAPGHGSSLHAESADSFFWSETVGFVVTETVPANVHVSFKYWMQKIPQTFAGCPILKRKLEAKQS